MDISEIIENGYLEIQDGLNFIVNVFNVIINNIAEELPIIYFAIILIIITFILVNVIKEVIK